MSFSEKNLVQEVRNKRFWAFVSADIFENIGKFRDACAVMHIKAGKIIVSRGPLLIDGRVVRRHKFGYVAEMASEDDFNRLNAIFLQVYKSSYEESVISLLQTQHEVFLPHGNLLQFVPNPTDKMIETAQQAEKLYHAKNVLSQRERIAPRQDTKRGKDSKRSDAAKRAWNTIRARYPNGTRRNKKLRLVHSAA